MEASKIQNFHQFLATERQVTLPELCELFGIAESDYTGTNTSGALVYGDDSCYIETLDDDSYYLVIGRSYWASRDRGPLAVILFYEHFLPECCDSSLSQELAKPINRYRVALTDDALVKAARIDDLNASLVTLMDPAGIDDRGIAGIVFSGTDRTEQAWSTMNFDDRFTLLKEWRQTEINAASIFE